jgi:Domain of unknown function (DUF1918)
LTVPVKRSFHIERRTLWCHRNPRSIQGARPFPKGSDPSTIGRRNAKTSKKERLRAMKAHVGDWLVVKGTTVARPDQRGLITEVRSADGSPPYVVRWQATSHVATVFPGPDALVITSEELEIADARARSRTHA